jgi:hypothetical protein
MLGEKIGEISGKVTIQRVLPNLGGDPKMETSFQATGSVLGTNIKDTGTYWTICRPDGTQYGEGQGIMITKDWQNGHLDRTWCWHIEKRRNRDLSRRALFPNHAREIIAPEQGRRAIRVRSRRRGQYTLRILGMEINRCALQHLRLDTLASIL